MFGPDSVPVVGVMPGVTCERYLHPFPVYWGPQYVGPVVAYVFPIPHSPFSCKTYPVGHSLFTTVELVDVEQFDESLGTGKYPEGHVAGTVGSTFERHKPLTLIVVPAGHTLRTVTAEPVGRLHLVLSTSNST